jgi:hypothetical protein
MNAPHMNDSNRCEVFVTEDKERTGVFSVQFQLDSITITFTAGDLLFAQRILDFVSETRANPAYRDAEIGNGVYRTMPEKSVDLSSSFCDTKVVLLKDGEYDSGYVLRITPSKSCAMILDIYDERLDALLSGIQDIVDELEDTSKDT